MHARAWLIYDSRTHAGAAEPLLWRVLTSNSINHMVPLELVRLVCAHPCRVGLPPRSTQHERVELTIFSKAALREQALAGHLQVRPCRLEEDSDVDVLIIVARAKAPCRSSAKASLGHKPRSCTIAAGFPLVSQSSLERERHIPPRPPACPACAAGTLWLALP